MKLRVCEYSGHAKNAGRRACDGGAEQRVDAIGGYRSVRAESRAGPQSSRDRILTDWNAPGRQRENSRDSGSRIYVGSKPLRSARGISARVSDGKWSKEPIKAELINVVLGDLEEFGFDFHLRGLDADGSVHQRVDEIDGIRGIADDEFAARGDVLREGAGRESDALGLQIFKRVRPAADTGLENFFTWRTGCRGTPAP